MAAKMVLVPNSSKRKGQFQQSLKMSIYQRIREYVAVLYKADIGYTRWDGGKWKDEEPPFYYSMNPPPETQFVKENGCSCSGFINLVCREVGARIPKNNYGYSGGTYEWTNQVAWIPINKDQVFPNFALVMVPFKSDDEPEGHLGIVIDDVIYHCMGGSGITTDSYPWEYYCIPQSYLK